MQRRRTTTGTDLEQEGGDTVDTRAAAATEHEGSRFQDLRQVRKGSDSRTEMKGNLRHAGSGGRRRTARTG